MTPPAFIWDLDGTLFDSYPIIVSAVQQTLGECGIHMEKDVIFREVTATSVLDFIHQVVQPRGLDTEALFRRSNFLQTSLDDQVQLNPHAADVLHALEQQGAAHFVCTHKGASAPDVLEKLGIREYFREIITADSGFPRKPDPSGVEYLIHKYALDKARCYYVGDRKIDLQCAANAKIQSILYLYSPSSAQSKNLTTYCVEDLRQILELPL